MARKRKHRSRSHRGGRFWGLYVFFTAVLVTLTIAAGSIVFFKVSDVEVYVRDENGNTAALSEEDHYSEEEILRAAGIHKGDNLLLIGKNRSAAAILNRLPYISSIAIRRHLPGTLELTISQSEPAAAVQISKKDWWLIDVNGKLLEESTTSKNSAVLKGLTLVDPVVGDVIQVADGSDPELSAQLMQKDSLLKLLPPLSDYGLLRDVKSIDLSSESELVVNYKDRIQVKIPLEADFDYKIKYFARILTDYVAENWSESDTGVLDMTYDDGHPHLTKNSQRN